MNKILREVKPKINCLLQMISMLGQMPRLLPRAPVVSGVLRKPHLVFDIPPCSRGAKTPAKAKGGGKKGAAMVKPVLEVETDAHKASLTAVLTCNRVST